MLYIFLTVIYIFTRYKRRIILLLVRLRYSCSGTRSLLSVVYLFLSLTGGTPRRLVRHHRSGIQKKQDDTRQSSNGPRTRTPPTYVITELQTNLDLRNTILPENKPNGPVSYGCKFPLVFSLPVSSNVRFRVLYRRTIGAGTRVRLGFPNARPVVSDERSEEFRRSVIEKARRPTEATGSPNTNTEDE